MTLGSNTRRVVVVGLNAVVAVAVPLLVADADVFTAAEAYLLGALLFIALTVLELTFAIDALSDSASRQLTRVELDTRLQGLARLIEANHERPPAPDDLFSYYFDRKLAELEESLKTASDRDEVLINETLYDIRGRMLRTAFRGRRTDIFRAVHLCDDNDFFFGSDYHDSFRQRHSLVEAGKIVAVRRLVVYNDRQELDDGAVRRLLTFHEHTPRYEARTLQADRFWAILSSFGISHGKNLDFGIQGTAYLFTRGVLAPGQRAVGRYTRAQHEIALYRGAFDECWSVAEPESMGQPTAEVTVDWLFTGVG